MSEEPSWQRLKYCSSCKKRKPETQFYEPGTQNSHCMDCEYELKKAAYPICLGSKKDAYFKDESEYRYKQPTYTEMMEEINNIRLSIQEREIEMQMGRIAALEKSCKKIDQRKRK